MRIVVTGAAGYIGGAITTRLVAAGHRVTSVGLHDPEIPEVEHHDWDIREEIPERLRHRLRFTDAVVHTAQLRDDWAGARELHDLTVTGTRHVLDAFPTPRMICLSSADVYDPRQTHHELYEEGGPVDPSRYLCDYERSWAEAERVAARVRPDALVLRPHAVYGPDDTTLHPLITRALRGGTLRLPAGGRNRLTMTHIDTLTEAVEAALGTEEAFGPMNIGDPKPYVLGEALNTYLARFGHPSIEFDGIAADLALVKAWSQERRARRRKKRPPYTRRLVRHLVRERTYSLERMHRQLGVTGVPGLRPSPARARLG